MRINLYDDGNIMTITNDGFENDNFVEITIELDSGDTEIDNNIYSFNAPIDELYTAVKALHDQRTRRQDWDNKLK